MIDPSSAGPAYRQLARTLEQHIRAADEGYGAGRVLPAAETLALQLGLGPKTVRDAYRLLEDMGLVTSRQGYGVQVRTPRDREIIPVPPGTVVHARMPTFAEIDLWGLEAGVPMLVVDGRTYPADRYELRVGTDAEPSSAPAAER